MKKTKPAFIICMALISQLYATDIRIEISEACEDKEQVQSKPSILSNFYDLAHKALLYTKSFVFLQDPNVIMWEEDKVFHQSYDTMKKECNFSKKQNSEQIKNIFKENYTVQLGNYRLEEGNQLSSKKYMLKILNSIAYDIRKKFGNQSTFRFVAIEVEDPKYLSFYMYSKYMSEDMNMNHFKELISTMQETESPFFEKPSPQQLSNEDIDNLKITAVALKEMILGEEVLR